MVCGASGTYRHYLSHIVLLEIQVVAQEEEEEESADDEDGDAAMAEACSASVAVAPPPTTGVDLTSKQIKSIVPKAKGSNKDAIKLSAVDRGTPAQILKLQKRL